MNQYYKEVNIFTKLLESKSILFISESLVPGPKLIINEWIEWIKLINKLMSNFLLNSLVESKLLCELDYYPSLGYLHFIRWSWKNSNERGLKLNLWFCHWNRVERVIQNFSLESQISLQIWQHTMSICLKEKVELSLGYKMSRNIVSQEACPPPPPLFKIMFNLPRPNNFRHPEMEQPASNFY